MTRKNKYYLAAVYDYHTTMYGSQKDYIITSIKITLLQFMINTKQCVACKMAWTIIKVPYCSLWQAQNNYQDTDFQVISTLSGYV